MPFGSGALTSERSRDIARTIGAREGADGSDPELAGLDTAELSGKRARVQSQESVSSEQ